MMISYESGIADTPLSGDTIGSALRQRVAASGERLALVSRHQGVHLTWSDLAERAAMVARGLIALGVEPGDRVGIWAPTRVEWTELQFGSAMVGAILVNINPAYRAGELSYALSKSGVRILAAVAGFRDADYFGMLQDDPRAVPVAGAGGRHRYRRNPNRRGLGPDLGGDARDGCRRKCR